jgi:putative flippase GtrA
MAIILQILRFAAVGATGVLIQYSALWVGTERLGLVPALASALGYAMGSVANYLLNRTFTFNCSRPHGETIVRFYSVATIGWCLNTVIMALFAHRFGHGYWIVQIAATGICFVWNFCGNRYWAFRQAAAATPTMIAGS